MRRLIVVPPLLVIILCGFLAVSEERGETVTIENIRLGVDGEGETRIVLDVDRRPAFIVGPITGKNPEIAVHVEASHTLLGDNGAGMKPGIGLVESVSWGPSLITLHLAETALPVRQFILPPTKSVKHHRLVIDLASATEKDFAKAAEAFSAPPAEPPAPALLADVETQTAAAAAPAPSLKPSAATLPLAQEEAPVVAAPEAGKRPARRRPLIVLDPGHGGSEPGAIGQGGTAEDTVTLAFAQELRTRLTLRGYDVLLTRHDDTYVRHEDRIGLARERHADLFMSIHADSHPDHTLRGGSVYTLSERRSEKLEDDIRRDGNFVLFDVELSNDDGVSDILLDLAQSAALQNSDRLATSLISHMQPVMPLIKNPKRRGALLVLLSPDVPAVLVELAFISNDQDEANLTSLRWRQNAAEAIANGVDEYFAASDPAPRFAGTGNAG